METTFLSTLVIAVAIIVTGSWLLKTKPAKKMGDITIDALDTIDTQLKVVNTNGQIELLDAQADLDFARSEEGKSVSASLAKKKMLARASIKLQELQNEVGNVDDFAELFTEQTTKQSKKSDEV